MSEHYIASKLKWDIHGVFNDFEKLKDLLEDERNELPEESSKKRGKLERWLNELNDILNKLDYIEKILISSIEKAFQYRFNSPDLVKLIFFQPSVNNLFSELEIHLNQTQAKTINVDYNTLSNFAEAAKVLALIGDSALDLAVAQLFWESKIARAGNISQKRASLVSNENLAKACDRLNLYDHRIRREAPIPPTKDELVHHVKATLIEAIYGIIYTEKGIETVFDALVAIK